MIKTHPYSITLSEKEKERLKAVSGSPGSEIRSVRRALTLLMLDRGLGATEISRQLDVARATVHNCAARYREGGIDRAIYDSARSGGPRRIPKEAAEWIRKVYSEPPAAAGVNAPRWTLTLLREYAKNEGSAHGFSEISTVSRSRLWELITERPGHTSRGNGLGTAGKHTVEVAWRQFDIEIEEGADGLWRAVLDREDEKSAGGTVLHFLAALILDTGRLIFFPGSRRSGADMTAFLKHLDRITAPGATIELMNPKPEERLPPETENYLFSHLGRFALIFSFKKRYGELLPTTAGFAASACIPHIAACRGSSPSDLQQSVLAALSRVSSPSVGLAAV